MPCPTLTGLALLECLAANPACLPPEGRSLAPVLIEMARQESGGHPYAIRSETQGREITPRPRTQAEAIARALPLLRRGEVLGLGAMQITWQGNHEQYFGSYADLPAMLRRAFDPCANLRAGYVHLRQGIRRYNGSGPAAERYTDRVVQRVGHALRPATPEVPGLPPRPLGPAMPRRPAASVLPASASPPAPVAVFSRPAAPGRALVIPAR